MTNIFVPQRIFRRDDGYTLGNHELRIARLERSPVDTCGPWYYVGAANQAGVDAYGHTIASLIATNPNGTIVPFQNGWTNSLGLDSPVSFMRDGCMTVIRGGFFGGSTFATVFTLPVGFRPLYQQEILIPTGNTFDYATAIVNADGTVNFEQFV